MRLIEWFGNRSGPSVLSGPVPQQTTQYHQNILTGKATQIESVSGWRSFDDLPAHQKLVNGNGGYEAGSGRSAWQPRSTSDYRKRMPIPSPAPCRHITVYPAPEIRSWHAGPDRTRTRVKKHRQPRCRQQKADEKAYTGSFAPPSLKDLDQGPLRSGS